MAYRRLLPWLLVLVVCEGFERRSREGFLRDLMETVSDRLGHRFGKRFSEPKDISTDQGRSKLLLDILRETRGYRPGSREFLGNSNLEYRREARKRNVVVYPSVQDEFFYRYAQ